MIRRTAWLMAAVLALAILIALAVGVTLLIAVLIALPVAVVVWEGWDVQMERRREG